jgi:hypothetical protein
MKFTLERARTLTKTSGGPYPAQLPLQAGVEPSGQRQKRLDATESSVIGLASVRAASAIPGASVLVAALCAPYWAPVFTP